MRRDVRLKLLKTSGVELAEFRFDLCGLGRLSRARDGIKQALLGGLAVGGGLERLFRQRRKGGVDAGP